MNSTELGRRLREARLAKKMTQSEVVGNFITRNMLSQIESGTAMPSMKTLEFLSGVLEVPMERLIAEQDEPACTQPALAQLQAVKKMLAEGKYKEILAAEDLSGLLEDEFQAIRSIASLRIAEDLAQTQEIASMQEALIHAKRAAQEAMVGIYANPARAAQAQTLISQIAKFLSSYYSDLAQAGV